MGILDWITGGGRTADKIVDAAINTGDALFFTDEEKSQANMKRLEWTLAYLKTTSGQNVARRLIAIGVVGLWITLVLVAVVSGYLNHADGSYSAWVFGVLEDVVNAPFMIILTFYFATSLARAYKGGG
jgi:uncharacterized membrane protein YhaH (DUF805 family)